MNPVQLERESMPKPLADKLYVGRPNIGSRQAFLERVNDILDRRWLSNDGRYVQEFERMIAEMVGVKHCVSICNATIALQMVTRALDLKGEVILPSYTFVACAHALQWQEITPVFCDIDPTTHLIDPEKLESLITPRTTGIMGVHLWGRGCQVNELQAIADKHHLQVFYDASHAFGCTIGGKPIGGFGRAEIFSFHATKFINSLEGGAVTTNDDELANKLRMMRNFGFTNFDQVEYLGINGKMNEVSAAMGITNLEAIDEIVAANRANYLAYQAGLQHIPGLSLINYAETEQTNFQYVVVEVDPEKCPVSRDAIVAELHKRNVIARKYFWPGCHRMEPYKSLYPNSHLWLQETEKLAARIIVLPTGETVSPETVFTICRMIEDIVGE
jgi:dTDP-4-amino-4,6-dideoxygalactose transaminase